MLRPPVRKAERSEEHLAWKPGCPLNSGSSSQTSPETNHRATAEEDEACESQARQDVIDGHPQEDRLAARGESP